MGRPDSPVELELRLGHVGSSNGSTGTARLHLVAGEGSFLSRQGTQIDRIGLDTSIRITVTHEI